MGVAGSCPRITTTTTMPEPASIVDTFWGDLTGPLGDPLTRRALLEICLIGITSGAIGCWIVLFGLSYSSESLSHSILPGLVVATLAGAPLLLGGAIGILVAALAISLVARVPELDNDTSVAIVVTTLFGLGALLALSPSSPPGIQDLLFGDVLGVSNGDLLLAAGAAVVSLVALRALHGQLLTVGFDRGTARALGASPALAETALLVLIALAVLIGIQGLGNLLVVAVLVGPAATARLLCKRLVPMMAVAAAVAMLGGAIGLYASYYAGTAAGASVAGALVALFLIAAAAAAVSGRTRQVAL
jgi:ABC-type Mn2+/Zn2+ transport system permease subunit